MRLQKVRGISKTLTLTKWRRKLYKYSQLLKNILEVLQNCFLTNLFLGPNQRAQEAKRAERREHLHLEMQPPGHTLLVNTRGSWFQLGQGVLSFLSGSDSGAAVQPGN